jgi:hypothetical protein
MKPIEAQAQRWIIASKDIDSESNAKIYYVCTGTNMMVQDQSIILIARATGDTSPARPVAVSIS